MKILFLHLGDIHTENKMVLNNFQVKKIADTVNSFSDFDKLVLVIAGDISQSGKAEEYKYAKRLIGTIISSIKNTCNVNDKIDVICVPGNHDIDYNNAPRSSKELQKIRKTKSYDKNLNEELEKQTAFFNFANYNKCFFERNVYSQKILNYDNFKIEVNMINSGVFSSTEEDKGLHYMPQYAINDLATPTGADFVITVMHHAPDWYTDDIKNTLEEIIYQKSSIVFLGHEHFLAHKSVSYEANAPVIIQAGGCLCYNENWTNSAFHVGIVDSSTNNYTHGEFRWNARQNQYESNNLLNTTITAKPSIEKTLQITDEFESELLLDKKHEISSDFRDYYVFPRIQTEDRKPNNIEFITEQDFINEIIDKKKVLISGGYNAGKTALLKKLFFSLTEKNYVVLYCNIDNIRGKNAERIIKNCFEDTYGGKTSDYTRFQQTPKTNKVIIVDDIDQIKSDSLENLVSSINEKFEIAIFASKQIIGTDLLERMKTQLSAVDSVHRYKLLPLYADKRNELIHKVVSIKAIDPSSIERTSKLLSEAITMQRRYISLDPDFIIKYVEYYCNNVGESSANDSGVFSKVFEASLINSISKHQTTTLSVDKVFIILSKIAHFIHFNKMYPISESQIMAIIDKYNLDYGNSVKGTDFIRIVSKAKILIYDSTLGGYRFTNKNYLAYYVAREVNSRYNASGDDTDLQSIIRCACFGINADILLFISYITDNIKVLRYILNVVDEFTENWVEFDFTDNLPHFMRREVKYTIFPPSPNTLEEEKQLEVMNERASNETIQTTEIYDYSEDEIQSFANQLIRAIQLLTIVSRCLPNFEHAMLKSDKDRFIKVIYQLPNKIFHLWATEADKEISEIVLFFKEQSQDYYIRQKQLTDDEIVEALQWSAMSFLLDLYNLAVIHSTKDNTIVPLSGFDYSKSETYNLQYLMMLERKGTSNQFVSHAIHSLKNSISHLSPTLISRVVNHSLVFRSDLDYKQIHQLESKFFPNKKNQKKAQKKILSKRVQNRKKEND